jgi:ATP-dependent helicase/nuclease subunit B
MDAAQPELPLFDWQPAERPARVFTIPPTAPFLDVLARAILAGELPGTGKPPSQLDLAAYEIYLPNRAACRALANVFLKFAPDGATLLPCIRPLGGAEEDALLLLTDELETGEADRADLPVPPAIGPLDRRLALTRLILAWVRHLKDGGVVGAAAGVRLSETPAAAAELALELMRLMDEAESEGVDLTRLADLVPERFAGHEQLALSFLDIVVRAWPAHLEASGLLNPVERRNRLMALEAERLARTRPGTPVIIAGSTGSIPATAALMKAVAGLPNGAIVLPGIDMLLDDPSWNAIAEHPEHPQAGMLLLLGELGLTRTDVRQLSPAGATSGEAPKLRLLSESLRPGSTLGRWPQFIAGADAAEIRAALADVSVIAAPTEQDEAAAIALIMREAIERPQATVNLVTPDRTLARRVAAELTRWGLSLSASSGMPLAASEAGIFFDLIAEAAATGSCLALLTLMKHPLTRLGLPEEEAHRAARIVEIAAMRQPWCGDGLQAIGESLEEARRPKPRHAAIDRLTDADWQAAADVLARLGEALAPLLGLVAAGAVPLDRLAAAHLECARHFLASEDEVDPALHSFVAPASASAAAGGEQNGPRLEAPGDERIGSDPKFDALTGASDRAALARYLTALGADVSGLELPFSDYPALFRSLIKLESIRPERAAHPRLQILSAMEARLTSADLVILAGLNEGVWPEPADPGPWLNRAMRAALGFPPPERKTRLAAHDFWQMMGAREVVLTRALKSGGAPTVPSRWLMRLQTLLKGLGVEDALSAPRPWLHWASLRNEAAPPSAAKAPAPCPPLAARPRSLSVSDIERLIANPYAIYARHILGLAPLNALEGEPGGAEKGQIIHEVLHRFARRHAEGLPRDPVRVLMKIFDECATLYGERAHVQAFWRPRMERFAAWFAETETARRGGALVLSELRGRFEFEAPGGPFTLRARADRIDLAPDGTLAIYDYKSGGIPSEGAVKAFRAPQLPLEALIAAQGGFDGVASSQVAKLVYISAKGGEPAGLEQRLMAPVDGLVAGARGGLAALIARFDDETTPYKAMRRAAFGDAYAYDDYAHLARVGEWAGVEEEEG